VHTGRVIEVTPADIKTKVGSWQAGDVYYLHAGTYSGVIKSDSWNFQSNFDLISSPATADRPIAFVGYPGEVATLTGAGLSPNFNLADSGGGRQGHRHDGGSGSAPRCVTGRRGGFRAIDAGEVHGESPLAVRRRSGNLRDARVETPRAAWRAAATFRRPAPYGRRFRNQSTVNRPTPAFSSRVPADLAPNRLTRLLARLRTTGVDLADLTETNPTRVGLNYPGDLLASLASPASLVYDPHPFGLAAARETVAAECGRRWSAPVDPARVVLTASTSEAYSLLFKLLCDPGDEVVVPRPSYPLFDHLTTLDAVVARPYALEFHGEWSVDLDSVGRAITPRTRAILVVSPNNPTGAFLSPSEIGALGALAADHGLALVGDEVFADYPIDDRRADAGASVLGPSGGAPVPPALTFSLGGLSKSAGLPQLKLGWIVTGGPPALVASALARLEIIADAYLSVGTPVQQAAASLIEAGTAIRRQILARVRLNHQRLRALAAEAPACTLLPAAGGWSAVLRVPATRSEERLVLELLEHDHVLVLPGYFFDFPAEAYLVVSLLPDPATFDRGVKALLARVSH
jgi:aspartate/methionine/tyrosine aminotransferase